MCTSQLQAWNRLSREVKLEPCTVEGIKFTKLEYGKVKRPITSKTYDPWLPKHSQTSSDEIAKLRSSLCEMDPDISFVHVIKDPSIPVTSASSVSTLLPPIPRSAIEKVKYQLRTASQPPSLHAVVEAGKELTRKITPDSEGIAAIEKATIGQRIRKRWHEERYGRLTSSHFGRICKANKLENLATQLLYSPQSSLSSSAIQWGIEHESAADSNMNPPSQLANA